MDSWFWLWILFAATNYVFPICTGWKEKFVRGCHRWILHLRNPTVKLTLTLNFKVSFTLYSRYESETSPNLLCSVRTKFQSTRRPEDLALSLQVALFWLLKPRPRVSSRRVVPPYLWPDIMPLVGAHTRTRASQGRERNVAENRSSSCRQPVLFFPRNRA